MKKNFTRKFFGWRYLQSKEQPVLSPEDVSYRTIDPIPIMKICIK